VTSSGYRAHWNEKSPNRPQRERLVRGEIRKLSDEEETQGKTSKNAGPGEGDVWGECLGSFGPQNQKEEKGRHGVRRKERVNTFAGIKKGNRTSVVGQDCAMAWGTNLEKNRQEKFGCGAYPDIGSKRERRTTMVNDICSGWGGKLGGLRKEGWVEEIKKRINHAPTRKITREKKGI